MMWGMKWKTLIEDLLKRGYTQASLGRELEITGEAVRALTINFDQEPRYKTGAALIALHKKAMRKYPKIDAAA